MYSFRPGITGRSWGLKSALFLLPNRGYGRPISGPIPQGRPEIAHQLVGINGTLFLGPNRGYGYPIIGPIAIRYRIG